MVHSAEDPPGRIPSAVSSRCHVLRNGGLADIDAELEELSMDAGSTPERIGEAHLADQPPNFRRYAGLPARRRDFQRQNERKPARCQRTIVSGRTIVTAFRMDGASRYSRMKTRRSDILRTGRFVALRHSTLS